MIFSDLSMTEAGAMFVGALAYPAAPLKAQQVAGVLICSAVDMMVADPGKWGEPPNHLRLVCQLRNRADCEKALSHATRIISSERLIAAKQAYPVLHASIMDSARVQRPTEVPRPLSKEMVAAVSIDLADVRRPKDKRGRKPAGGEADGNKSNIDARCWRPSLPVLHMALALHLENESLNVGDILMDGELAARLIQLSNQLAPLVADLFEMDRQAQVLLVPDLGVQ